MNKIYTIGHSNRSLREFLQILLKLKIKNLVDVRRFPTSKRFPHFNKENLKEAVEGVGIKYFYLGNELGGFRKGGYEAYTKTKEFEDGINKLIVISKSGRTVVMCSERFWFRCHRRFIARKLKELGFEVVHIVE